MAEAQKLVVAHEWAADQWDWPLQRRDGVVKVINNPNHFEVGLELHHFTPKEVDLKILGHEIMVHCEHDARTDRHGTVSRTLDRNYRLPADVDLQSVKAVLKADGILHIFANKVAHATPDITAAKNVPILTQ